MREIKSDMRNHQNGMPELTRAQFSSIHHMVRTPLHAIFGMAQIAEATEDIGKIKYCIGVIKKTSENLMNQLTYALEMPEAGAGMVSDEDVRELFHGKRALLVDDVKLNRIIAIELLADTGLLFDEAEDGAQAVDMALKNRYDVILMDIQMPRMDGHEAIRRIRRAAKPYSDVPTIAFSANVLAEDIRQGKEEGFDAYLGKPVHAEELIATISGVMH